jgi:hypothetical protein
VARHVEIDIESEADTKGFEETAGGAESAANRLDAMGRAANKAQRDLEKLDRQMAETAAEAAALRKEIEKGNNESLIPRFRAANDQLASLKAQRSEVEALNKDLQSALKTSTVDNNRASFQRLGDEVRKTDGSAEGLGRRIAELKNRSGQLAEEFARTGSTDVYRSLKDTRAAISGLQSVRREIEVFRGGRGVGDLGDLGNFSGVFSTIVKSVPPQILIPSAAALAVPLGAALNGALLLVGGSGLIAAGIIGAFQNTGVKAAFAELGTDLKAEFQDVTRSFSEPMELAASHIGDTLSALKPEFAGIFRTLAPEIDKLSTGIGGFLEKLTPGLQALADASKPVLDAFAQQLPNIAAAFTTFFEELKGGSKGAADALKEMLRELEGAVVVIGGLLEGLSNVFEFFDSSFQKAGSSMGGFLNELLTVLGTVLGQPLLPLIAQFSTLGDNGEHAASSFQYLNTTAGQAKQTLDALSQAAEGASLGSSLTAQNFKTLATAINQSFLSTDQLAGAMTDKLLGSLLAIDQSTLGVAQAHTQLADSLSRNHVASNTHVADLDITTAAGQANRAAILGVVQANIQNYDALIAAGSGAEDAAAAYDQNTAALRSQLRQAGLTEGQIDSLIGKYGQVPDSVNTIIILKGLAEAINGLNETLREINGLNGYSANASVHVTTYYNSVGTPAPGAPGGLHAGLVRSFAQGGIAEEHAASGLIRGPGVFKGRGNGYLVAAEGVTGKEGFIPQFGISRNRAGQLLGQMAQWHNYAVVDRSSPGYKMSLGSGGGNNSTYNISLQVPPNADLAAIGRVTVDAIRYYEKFNGPGWRSR